MVGNLIASVTFCVVQYWVICVGARLTDCRHG
jgi:hypothetical protein